MAASKKRTAAPADPVAVPPKLATQGPESGPYPSEVIVDADGPTPLAALHPATAAQSRSERTAAKKLENAKAGREVKVIATRRGYMGKIIEPGTVFTIQLGEGERAPTWVRPVDEATAPTPPAHSAEAQPEPQ